MCILSSMGIKKISLLTSWIQCLIKTTGRRFKRNHGMISREDVRVLFLRKVLETLAALLALVFLSFLFLHSMPGGPFDEEASLNPAVKENLSKLWALDQSFLSQFFH